MSGYRTNSKKVMQAFDKLPPAARKALADAVFNWSPQAIAARWSRGVAGFKTGHDIAQHVSSRDATEISKRNRRSKQ